MRNDTGARIAIDGVLHLQRAIGIEQPFAEDIAVVFEDRHAGS